MAHRLSVDGPRCLPPGVRARLKALIATVPEGAGIAHPAVRALRAYCGEIDDAVPWWASRGLAYRFALDDVRGVLDAVYRLADLDDWGEDPTLR